MPMLYLGNYLSCKGEAGTVGVRMETKLPVIIELCNFAGYDASSRMTEMARLRKIITKRGTLEILIPFCCSTKPVRYKQFKKTLKGISSKTLASRLKELEKGGILERRAYNEFPPRVKYRLTGKGQELIESVMGLLQ
jgi:DNA-binding HxlR family transcriptional regulator